MHAQFKQVWQRYQNGEIHLITEDEYLECSLIETAFSKRLPRQLVSWESLELKQTARELWKSQQR